MEAEGSKPPDRGGRGSAAWGEGERTWWILAGALLVFVLLGAFSGYMETDETAIQGAALGVAGAVLFGGVGYWLGSRRSVRTGTFVMAGALLFWGSALVGAPFAEEADDEAGEGPDLAEETFGADVIMANEMAQGVHVDLLYAETKLEDDERKTCHQVGRAPPDGLEQFRNAGQYALEPDRETSDECTIDRPSRGSFHVGVAVYDGPPSDYSAQERAAEEFQVGISGIESLQTRVVVCSDWELDVWVFDETDALVDRSEKLDCTERS